MTDNNPNFNHIKSHSALLHFANLQSDNGEIVATSEGYSHEKSARAWPFLVLRTGIDAIRDDLSNWLDNFEISVADGPGDPYEVPSEQFVELLIEFLKQREAEA